MTPRRPSLLDTTGMIYAWIHRDCEACTVSTMQDAAPSQGSGHRVPSLTKKLFAADTYPLGRGKSVFSSGVLLGINHIPRQTLCSGINSWPEQSGFHLFYFILLFCTYVHALCFVFCLVCFDFFCFIYLFIERERESLEKWLSGTYYRGLGLVPSIT